MLRHQRLQEYGRPFRIKPRRQPIAHHIERVLLYLAGISIVGRQGMPIRDEEKAVVFTGVLEPDPVLERALKITEVQAASGPHSADYPFLLNGCARQKRTPFNSTDCRTTA